MSTLYDLPDRASFDAHLSSITPTTLLVLSFHAPWAAPCAQMRTILTTLASTYDPTSPPTISFISIDAEALPEISESYDVTAVPFLVLQRDGKLLESVSGCDAAKVRTAIEKWYATSNEGKKSTLPPRLEATSQITEKTGPNDSVSSVANGHASSAKNLSSYAPSTSDPQTAPAMSGAANLASSEQTPPTDQDELNKRLAGLVKAAPVMLFMKGTPSSPQCGFSRQLVGILRERGVRYGFFNILADEEVRQGLKTFADWPTFPQLWVGGELVGGLDIVSRIPPHSYWKIGSCSAGQGRA